MNLKVKVIPNAKKARIEVDPEFGLKVWVKSSPIEGKANKELVKLLAKHYHLAKSSVEILKGQTSRNKLVKLG